MGLDIVLFDTNHAQIGLVEVSHRLHQALFAEQSYWRSYKYIRQLSDYYLTNLEWGRSEILQFASELEQLQPFVDSEQRTAVYELITLLSNQSIASVHIAGD